MNTNVQKMNSMIPAMNNAPSADSTAYMGGPVVCFSVLLIILVGIFSIYYGAVMAVYQSFFNILS